MKNGVFITFEGPDGSGKTTLSTVVYNNLKAQNYDVIITREPGGSRIAEEIRDVILDNNNVEMDAKTEALLYAASRRQHLVEKILPALKANKIVISDRFVDSSLAYQGVGREIGIDAIWDINMFAIEGNLPDMTIYLDIDAQTGLNRIASRKHKDRLDQEGITFHQRVTQGYELIKERFNDRMKVFDGTQEIDVLAEKITEFLITWIKQHD